MSPERTQPAAREPDHLLLDVRNLRTYFGARQNPVRAADGVSFSVNEGETTALVGESGCGKSVTALSLARLLPQPPAFYAGGNVLYRGEDVLQMSERRLLELRGSGIAYIFQEPASSLNPVLRVGCQIREAVKLHCRKTGIPGRQADSEVVRLMEMAGFPDAKRRMRAYPHEMSGGMQQRVMIAMALACRPGLLVADEPTTALDATIQAQILELLVRLQAELNMAVLLITHNLGLVAGSARRTYIMYAGRIVESGPTGKVLGSPAHPYTRGLLDAVPRLERSGRIGGIKGTVPDPLNLPPGCKFSPRCLKANEACAIHEPELTAVDGEHCVRCHFWK